MEFLIRTKIITPTCNIHNRLNHKYMVEKTEGAIKNGQFRDTSNIGHTKYLSSRKGGYYLPTFLFYY